MTEATPDNENQEPEDALDRMVTAGGAAGQLDVSTGENWIGIRLSGGRYTVNEKLGEGGMGAVYRAHDQNLATNVVVKVPHPFMLREAQFKTRFAREVRSLVQLSHPHICPIIDVGEYNGIPFAVMKYLAGGSLQSRRQRGPDGERVPMPLNQLLLSLAHIAQALDFVHHKGHVHRDIKPANILFDADGNVYLSDFGIAKAMEHSSDSPATMSLTGAGIVVGTAEYIAPEVFLGEPYDGRADQYALGVMVYELLCGHRPFDGPTPQAIAIRQATTEPTNPRELSSSIQEGVAEAVLQSLLKAPDQRHANCLAFVRALAKPRQQGTTPSEPSTAEIDPVGDQPSREADRSRGTSGTSRRTSGTGRKRRPPVTPGPSARQASPVADRELLTPATFVSQLLPNGPFEVAAGLRRLQKTPAGAEAENVELIGSLLEFLDDRAQFLQQFPEMASHEIYNELIPELPPRQAEAMQAAVEQAADELTFHRTSSKKAIQRRAHSNDVRAISLSRNQRLAATAGSDSTVCIWDMKRRACLRRIDQPADKVYLEPDGGRFWAVGKDSVSLWNTSEGTKLLEHNLSEMKPAWNGRPVLSLERSIGVLLGSGNTLRCFALDDGELLWRKELRPYEHSVPFALSGDGNWVFAVCRDEVPIVEEEEAESDDNEFDLATELLRVSRKKSTKRAPGVKDEPGKPPVLCALDAQQGIIRYQIPIPADTEVTCLGTDHSGQTVLLGTKTGRILFLPGLAETDPGWISVEASSKGVESLSLCADGSVVAVEHRDPYQAEVWRLRDTQSSVVTSEQELLVAAPLAQPDLLCTVGSVFHLASISADGRLLFTSNFNSSFSVTPVESGETVNFVQGVPHSVYEQLLSEDGGCVITGSQIQEVGGDSKWFEGLPAHKSHRSLKWIHPDLALIQKTSQDEKGVCACVWSRSKGGVAGVLQENGQGISAATADPPGTTILFSRSYDYQRKDEDQPATLTYMEIAAGKILEELPLPDLQTDEVYSPVEASSSSAPEVDQPYEDSALIKRVKNTRQIERLWYWNARNLVVGIADPPASDYSSPLTVFTFDPVKRTLGHAMELPAVRHSWAARLNQSNGWLVVAHNGVAKWYDLFTWEEVGRIELPKRVGLDASSCVAMNHDGSLLAAGGVSRTGVVYDTASKELLFVTSFDSRVSDVSFDRQTGAPVFVLNRGDVISYERVSI